MRQTLIVALALFLGCATGAAVRDIVVPARAQGSTGAAYEYQYVDVNSVEDSKLAELATRFGAQGWRLAHVVMKTNTSGPSALVFERSRSQAQQ